MLNETMEADRQYQKDISDAYKRGYEQGKRDAYKWISVDDRMPDEHESVFARFYGTWRWTDSMYLKKSDDVLVVEVYDDGTKRVGVAHTCDGEWKHDVPIIKRDVIAWMEYPRYLE